MRSAREGFWLPRWFWYCRLWLAQRGKVVVISLDGFSGKALDDPKQPIPTIQKLIAAGTGGQMLGINPTITWPNHTTTVTGMTADLHVLLLKDKIARTGEWAAGLTTAEVDWVAIKNAPTIVWSFPGHALPDNPIGKEMVAERRDFPGRCHRFPAPYGEGQSTAARIKVSSLKPVP